MSELIGRWNYYFLRYGAGTIVGAVIVTLFVGHLATDCVFFKSLLLKSNHGQWEFNGSVVVMYLILGFAYCYIAGAPVTVFHAARGLFWRGEGEEGQECHLPKLSFWQLVSISLICGLVLVAVIGCCHCFGSCHEILSTAVLIVLGLAILTLQWLLIVFTFTRVGRIRAFYYQLTGARGEQKTKADNKGGEHGDKVREYLESYRDLREHGNAYEIIFFEIVLAIILFNLNFWCAVWFIVLWIVPAALCWVVGTLLEFRFPPK